MTYSEQLRDRRWQKKRLEILERDHWQCQREGCKHRADDRVMLVVHHKVYRRGVMAWDYDGGDLVTLCQKCHDLEHRNSGFPLPDLREGEFFSWGDLNRVLRFTPSGYLTNAKGRIVCGCFRMDLNPDAPEIVLPGTAEPHWAEKSEGLPWEFRGFYRGEGMTRSAREIQIHRERNPERKEDISMVLFLEKVGNPEAPNIELLQSLWRQGSKAWGGVGPAARWVDKIRGTGETANRPTTVTSNE